MVLEMGALMLKRKRNVSEIRFELLARSKEEMHFLVITDFSCNFDILSTYPS